MCVPCDEDRFLLGGHGVLFRKVVVTVVVRCGSTGTCSYLATMPSKHLSPPQCLGSYALVGNCYSTICTCWGHFGRMEV